MALKRAAVILAVTMLVARAADGQSITTEVDVSGGGSSENVRAGGAQARIFGATSTDWRFFAEASWADVRGHDSDAFAAAYPYDARIRPMEIYAEKMFRPRSYLLGIRGGRYRTPFGISSRGDHGYTGFLRAPLIRYGNHFALSNTALEGGVDVIAGSPRLYVETSLGVPQDEGDLHRRTGVDAVVRLQGYYKALIVGVSRVQSGRDRALGSFAVGRSRFNGIDARWTSNGVQVRGEWIDGRPFDRVATRGGYLDVSVHRRALGPVTPLVRVERLDYFAGPFSLYQRRLTAGARIRIASCLTGQVNLIRQPNGLAAGRSTVLDIGATCAVRR
jgi:hypothetical protein